MGEISPAPDNLLNRDFSASAPNENKRDASFLVRDAEVAQYFETSFLFDWEVLATQQADESVGAVRLAAPGESTPVGFRRVSLSELIEA